MSWTLYVVPLVALAAIALYFVVFFARDRARGHHRRGLEPGEQVFRSYSARLALPVSMSEQVAGLLFGDATTRGTSLQLVMTSRDRVILAFDEDQAEPVQLGPEDRPVVRVIGEGQGTLGGSAGEEATTVVELALSEQDRLRVLVGDSCAEALVRWAQGGEVTLVV